MKEKLIVLSIIFIMMIGIIAYRELIPNDTLTIGVSANIYALPVLNAFDHDKLHFGDKKIRVILYETENEMFVDALNQDLDGFICDASTFILNENLIKNFTVVSSNPIELTLLTSPQNRDVDKLNEVKAAALGLSNYGSCELLLDLTIQSQNIIGLTMDEVLINEPLSRCKLLLDNSLDYGIYKSPYSDYLIANRSRIINQLGNFQPASEFLVFNRDYDTAESDNIRDFIEDLNGAYNDLDLLHMNTLIHYYLKLPKSFNLKESPDLQTFSKPDPDELDLLLSWLYNTKRIPTKYKYNDLVSDQTLNYNH